MVLRSCEIKRERLKIDPFTMVIFGGSGDLSRKKLLPTLFHLCRDQELPQEFVIISFASSRRSDEEYRELVRESISRYSGEDTESVCWRRFRGHLYYVQGRFDDRGAYERLLQRLGTLAPPHNNERLVIFYLASPPEFLGDIVENISLTGLNRGFNSRIIIEKPFGRDQRSAAELNRLVSRHFREDQIYRIDHYLGKETVQNLLYFRFANSIFEPLWNRRYIDHIQITVAESIGIENRAGFYDRAGVIRDIVQNHMMQLLALVAMEPPIDLTPDHIRDEKVKVIKSLRRMSEEYIDKYTVRGQYSRGIVEGREVGGYREEKGVPTGSNTPTFFAGRFFIDTWRWAGVPFYLRTGKRLRRRVTEISIHFRQPPLRLFETVCEVREPNVLVIGIQPREAIELHIGVKHPGIGNQLYPVHLSFDYERDLQGDVHFPLPYERLLLDCMKGDQTLFARQDAIEAMWAVVDPIIQRWESRPTSGLSYYPAGSWGPREADLLIQQDGRRWRLE